MKGVSPLLAGVILVMITVVSWSIISGWVQQLGEDQSSSIINQTDNKLRCSYADFYISRALINCSGSCVSGNTTITAWIKNSGETQVSFSKIMVQNTTGSLYSFSLNETKTLVAGELKNITVVSSSDCRGFNNTHKLDSVIISSSDCSGLYDSLDGSDVEFSEC